MAPDSRDARLLTWASCALPMLLIITALAAGVSDFARWDNLELYLPNLLHAHRRILHGDLPLWNPLQNLGEPIHAMGVAGVLYLPYTFSTWLVDAMGWNPRAVMSVIVVLHAGLAGLGLHCLCRSFGVRPLFAAVAAVSGALCGFALDVGAAWVPVMPDLAWAAWSLWGVSAVIQGATPRRGILVSALAIAMPFFTGHVQPALYNLIVSGAFAIALAVSVRRVRARVPWLAVAIVGAVLMAMPSLLPMAAIIPDTDRDAPLTREEFTERSFTPHGLLGLLLPVYPGDKGLFDGESLAPGHAGAWLIPALMSAFLLGLRRVPRSAPTGRRGQKSAKGPQAAPATGTRPDHALAVALGVAVVVIVLSLGRYTPVLGWTYGIPVWSSFRWSFRLFLHAVPLLMLSGAIALERIAHDPPARTGRIVPVACALLSAILWLVLPASRTPVAIVTAILGLAAMISVGWLDRSAGRVALAITAFCAAGSLIFFTHGYDRFKIYPDVRPGRFDPAALGIAPEFRLLPASPSVPLGGHLEDLGLYHSASFDGYHSLTGQRFAMTSRRLHDLLPTGDDGVLDPTTFRLFVGSHLMRAFNGRYVLVARNDPERSAILDTLTGYTRLTETASARIYQNHDALPRMFFATEMLPFSPRDLVQGLILDRVDATCAFVADPPQVGKLPAARVDRMTWGNEHVDADVTAPDGGFLVVAMNAWPDWVVRVDGVRRDFHIADGTLIGVSIPPGARRVALSYESPSLRRGSWLALLGAVVVVLAALVSARPRFRI